MYKGVAILLFSFVFIYLLLRILFNETLHDEVATYMFYFYHGNYIGDNIHWDANNHLLNSFIGHQLYKMFGDNMAIFRLPNLLAFILYFFGVIKLTKVFKTSSLRIIGLITLNTIPFVIEYFGNARGYGLSLSFFVWSLVHLHQYFKTYSASSLIFGYLFLFLAITANLTFVNSALILVTLLIIAPFLQKSNRPFSIKSREWVVHGLFLISISPLILFGLALKKTGALYYGSLDGLWEVTGKSLSKYVLFYDANWLKYVLTALFILVLIFCFRWVRKMTPADWLKDHAIIYALLFFGNLTGILILAYGMEVNYPEDRTGMYLILLLLLLLLHLADRLKIGKWLQWLFLFFPITFLMSLSLHTSVFSPDDRLNDKFYEAVKKEISPNNSIMIYKIINWNWPYHESHSTVKASVAQFNNPNDTLADIIVTKTTVLTNPAIPKLYDTIAIHVPSTYIAFKRKRLLSRISIDTSSTINKNTSQEFVEIASYDCNKIKNKQVQISVSGHLKTTKLKNKLMLVLQSSTAEGEDLRYYYYSFETTFQSQLIDEDFLHHFILDNIDSHEKQIKVYLWNRGLEPIELTNTKTLLFELKHQ